MRSGLRNSRLKSRRQRRPQQRPRRPQQRPRRQWRPHLLRLSRSQRPTSPLRWRRSWQTPLARRIPARSAFPHDGIGFPPSPANAGAAVQLSALARLGCTCRLGRLDGAVWLSLKPCTCRRRTVAVHSQRSAPRQSARQPWRALKRRCAIPLTHRSCVCRLHVRACGQAAARRTNMQAKGLQRLFGAWFLPPTAATDISHHRAREI